MADLATYAVRRIRVDDIGSDLYPLDVQAYELGFGLVEPDFWTELYGSEVDDGYYSGVDLGFDFVFDGEVYTDAEISTNGYIRLAGTLAAPGNPALYLAGADVILSPWWDDLKTSDVGYVRVAELGDPAAEGSGVFVVEWRVYQYSDQDAANKRELVFQCVLIEETQTVEFRYGLGEEVGAPSATSSASVGVKVDTTGSVDTNVRDFSGSDHSNGGSALAPYDAALSAVTGADYPGDPMNTIESEAFFYVFSPPLAELALAAGDAPSDGPFVMTLDGAPALGAYELDLVPLPTTRTFTTLEELAIVSLFSWARADADDEIPEIGGSRRGFWATELGDNFGSRLWLLERSKATRENRAAAREYVLDALQWMIDDELADTVEVEIRDIGAERAALSITIFRDGETALAWPDLWSAING